MKAKTIQKLKTMTTVLCAAILALLCVSCSVLQEEQPAKGTNVPISNVPQAAQSNKYDATLYFGFRDQELLTQEERTIEVPSNERVEKAILRELIKGPADSGGELSAVINPKTTVVSITDNGEFLFVTLSRDFLQPFGEETQNDTPEQGKPAAAELKLRLAVDSVVNALTELGQFAQVQLFIDVDGSGYGQRIKRKAAGFDTESGNTAGEQTLEPLTRQNDIILTPRNTADLVMGLLKDRKYTEIYNFTSFAAEKAPTPDELAQSISATERVVEEYTITAESVAPDGLSAIVTADITVRDKNANSLDLPSIPLRLIRVKNCWKISTLMLQHIYLISQS